MPDSDRDDGAQFENGEAPTIVGYTLPLAILLISIGAIIFFPSDKVNAFSFVTSMFLVFCAVLITFLVGVRWGIATSHGHSATWAQFGVSLVSLLVIWVAVVLSCDAGMEHWPVFNSITPQDPAQWPRGVSLGLLILAVILLATWKWLSGARSKKERDKYSIYRTIVTVCLGLLMAIALAKVAFFWPKGDVSTLSPKVEGGILEGS